MEPTAALSVVFAAPDVTAPDVTTRSASTRARSKGDRTLRRRVTPTDVVAPAPDRPDEHAQAERPRLAEPPALVVVELPGADRAQVLRGLLDTAGPAPVAPAGSYLVLRHGRPAEPRAFIPGYRHPPADQAGDGSAPPVPSRPARRIETALPAPLLKHATLVMAPSTETFGPAYSRIVVDVAQRGGALLLVGTASTALGEAELDLAAQAVDRGVAVFLAFTHEADADDWTAALAAAQAGAVRHSAVLTQLTWYPFDGTVDGAGDLRDAVLGWAAEERRHRTAPARRPGRGGPIRVGRDGPDSGWEELLRREIKWRCHAVWQRLAIELAHIHLRGVHELIFGTGCPGLPPALDRELHSLSVFATRALDAAVVALIDRVLPQVLAIAPDEAGLRLIGSALRRTLELDVSDDRDRDRVLLVTSTAGLAVVSGTGADVNLDGYRTGPDTALAGVLPPIGIALTGGCYLFWRDPAHADVDKCRYWLQRVVREVENELRRELDLRFQDLGKAVLGLLQDAVEHGIVLV